MTTPLRDLVAKVSFKADDGLANFDRALDQTSSRITKLGAGLAGALGVGWGVNEAVTLANTAEMADLHFRKAVSRFPEAEGSIKASMRSIQKEISSDLGINASSIITPAQANAAAAIFFRSFDPTPERMEVFATLSKLAARHMVFTGQEYAASFSTMLEAATTGNAQALEVFGVKNKEFVAIFNMISDMLKNDGAAGIVGMNANMERFKQLATEAMREIDPVIRAQKLEFLSTIGLKGSVDEALARLAAAGLELIAPAIDKLTTWLEKIMGGKDGPLAELKKEVPTTSAAVAMVTGGELPEEVGVNIPGWDKMSNREKGWAVFSQNMTDAMRGIFFTLEESMDPATRDRLRAQRIERETTAIQGEELKRQQFEQLMGDVTININGAGDPAAVAEEVKRVLLEASDVTAATAPAERVPKGK